MYIIYNKTRSHRYFLYAIKDDRNYGSSIVMYETHVDYKIDDCYNVRRGIANVCTCNMLIERNFRLVFLFYLFIRIMTS